VGCISKFSEENKEMLTLKLLTTLGRPRRRWVDNIKMDLREIVWDGMDWIDVTQDRDQWKALVNTVMNLRDLYVFSCFIVTISTTEFIWC
jgi:hypothetical protein